MNRHWILAGAISMVLAVLLGAFGAHAMKPYLTGDLADVYKTASSYHFYHSLGLMLLGSVSLSSHSRLSNLCGGLMVAGIMLFSGSLYLLSVTGIRWLGAITPLGGIALIISWVVFAAILWQSRSID